MDWYAYSILRRVIILHPRLENLEMECTICYEEFTTERIMVCGNGHPVCRYACYPRIKHCGTCRDPLQNFTDRNGNQPIDWMFAPCRHHQYGCENSIVPVVHNCAYELLDRLSPSAIKLLFAIVGLADFILVSGLEEPPLIPDTPQLEELQRVCSLETEEMWDRLIPDLELQSMILEIIDNF